MYGVQVMVKMMLINIL